MENYYINMQSEYLQPIKKSIIESLASRVNARSLFYSTEFYDGKIIENKTFDLFILGVNEDRFRPEYEGCKEAPDTIRAELYSLIKPRKDLSILDLGNIEAGAAISDTHFALTQVLSPLLKQKSIVVLIGGSQDLIAAQYAAFQGVGPNLQVVVVDAKAEMQMYEDKNANNYLPNIISHEPDYLFNLTQAAYQGYYVEPETYDAFERMNFDMLRLGSLRGNIQEIEPYLREAQMLAFSIKAIRGSDAMGQIKPSPNGLTGEEACQITRYAGMGTDLRCIGFFDYNPKIDNNGASALLLAQMIWYFIDGYTARKLDYPAAESKDYLIYRIPISSINEDLTFYKSVLTDRWWMEIPYPHERSKHQGKFLMPCSYKDYQTAQNNEIPDRWMKSYQKLI